MKFNEERLRWFKSDISQYLHVGYDATLVFASVTSTEGWDRSTLHMNELVLLLLDLIPLKGKVISSIVSPGPIILNEWNKRFDAILFNSMPGQQYGNGIVDVIFGLENPSAKLTFTIPNKENEQEMSPKQYPGEDGELNSTYSEQHHFGYRWYDQNMVKPAYEFGFGLSYTEFQYSALKITKQNDDMEVSFKVTNTGSTSGSEVAQLYLAVPKTTNFTGGFRSPKILKGFKKVKDLKPGQSADVTLTLDSRAFSFWSVDQQQWVLEKGSYGVMIGASSRDVRLSGAINI